MFSTYTKNVTVLSQHMKYIPTKKKTSNEPNSIITFKIVSGSGNRLQFKLIIERVLAFFTAYVCYDEYIWQQDKTLDGLLVITPINAM